MIDIDFKYYMSIFWKRFPFFLTIWLGLTVLGLMIAYILPPVYKSQAIILVEGADVTIVEGTVLTPAQEQIQLVETRLMTRPNLLEIAERYGVFGDEEEKSPTELVDDMKDATAFNQIQFASAIPRGPTATAFTLSFEHKSPVIAARVANEMVTRILEINREMRGGKADKTRDFFETRREELLSALTDVETQIVNLKNENQDALPENLSFNQREVSRIQERLNDLEREELAMKEQRAGLERVIEDPRLLNQAVPGRQQSPQQRQLEELQLQLAERSTVLSDRNPQIVQLKTRIEALEKIIAGQAVDTEDPESVTDGLLAPLYENVRKLNNSIELMAKQRAEFVAQLTALREAIAQTPNVKNQLNVLEREQQTLERQYTENESNLVRAIEGDVIEDTQIGERFSLIENPVIPDEPESPNRILIAVGSTVAGALLGLGLIVLRELLNTSVRRPADLVNGLGIQPFATIPYIATRREILRRRVKIAGAVIGVAAIIPAAVYAVDQFVLPVSVIMDRVLDRFELDMLKDLLS